AIKKLCYDDKVVTPARLHQALLENWEGEENQKIRELCLACPKYGNNDDYADSIGVKLWDDLKDKCRELKGPYGNKINISGVSITAHGPGGKLTGATPDGRYSGDVLADGSISPAQGADHEGPTASLLSGMKMAHGWSATLHNMKFDPTALKSEEDLEKLGEMIKIYMTNGGHHIQFTVVNADDLKEAKVHPENYSDLMVRVAGYSTYFTILTPAIQTDIITRTTNEHL
ncbi:MAG: hypothetical protein IJM08_06740, partial [Firmicutes bacterium]|nr:hypothetical protein [Bacillota bacterium]